MHATITFVALLTLMQLPLTLLVGFQRLKTSIQFLDGGNKILMQRMRAHGNFTETVPITLLALGAAEYMQLPAGWLWFSGTALLIGRIIHAHVLIAHGWGNGRAIGMALTFLAMCICACGALFMLFKQGLNFL